MRLSLNAISPVLASLLLVGSVALTPTVSAAQDVDVFVEVQEDKNGQLIIKGLRPQVKRATIIRDRLKQRNNGLYRMRARSGSSYDDPQTTAVSAELQLSYTDAEGQTVSDMPVPVAEANRYSLKTELFSFARENGTTSYITASGDVVTIPDEGPISATWVSPVYGEVPLELDILPKAMDREDGQMGAIIYEGVIYDDDGNEVNRRRAGGRGVRLALIDPKGNRSKLKVRMSGKPEAFGSSPFSTALYGEILISGEPITFDDEDRVWVADPVTISASTLDGQTYQMKTTTFNGTGDVIDTSTVTGIAGETDVEPAGADFGRSFLATNDDGNLSFSTSITANTKSEYGLLYEIVENDLLEDENVEDVVKGMSVKITDNSFAAPLLSAQNIKPETIESFALWTDLFAIEPDNVVDMEYVVGFDVYAPGNEVPEFVTIKLSGSEEPRPSLSVVEFGDLTVGAALWLNEDGETFTLRAKASAKDNQSVIFEEPFEGPAPLETQILLNSITPDDGGSEFERDAAVLTETGGQFFFSAVGDGGLGSLGLPNGGDILISAKVGDGEMADMLVNLTVKDVKELSRAFGFGKGTKKSTTTTSARPELQ